MNFSLFLFLNRKNIFLNIFFLVLEFMLLAVTLLVLICSFTYDFLDIFTNLPNLCDINLSNDLLEKLEYTKFKIFIFIPFNFRPFKGILGYIKKFFKTTNKKINNTAKEVYLLFILNFTFFISRITYISLNLGLMYFVFTLIFLLLLQNFIGFIFLLSIFPLVVFLVKKYLNINLLEHIFLTQITLFTLMGILGFIFFSLNLLLVLDMAMVMENFLNNFQGSYANDFGSQLDNQGLGEGSNPQGPEGPQNNPLGPNNPSDTNYTSNSSATGEPSTQASRQILAKFDNNLGKPILIQFSSLEDYIHYINSDEDLQREFLSNLLTLLYSHGEFYPTLKDIPIFLYGSGNLFYLQPYDFFTLEFSESGEVIKEKIEVVVHRKILR